MRPAVRFLSFPRAAPGVSNVSIDANIPNGPRNHAHCICVAPIGAIRS